MAAFEMIPAMKLWSSAVGQTDGKIKTGAHLPLFPNWNDSQTEMSFHSRISRILRHDLIVDYTSLT